MPSGGRFTARSRRSSGAPRLDSTMAGTARLVFARTPVIRPGFLAVLVGVLIIAIPAAWAGMVPVGEGESGIAEAVSAGDSLRRSGESPRHPFQSDFPRAELTEAGQFRENYLLGDWWGARSWLADRGIKPSVLLITDAFGNPVGGKRQGFGVYNMVAADLLVETTKAVGGGGV